MGVFSGPDVSESGLVLAFDAGNSKSYPDAVNYYSTPETLTNGRVGSTSGGNYTDFTSGGPNGGRFTRWINDTGTSGSTAWHWGIDYSNTGLTTGQLVVISFYARCPNGTVSSITLNSPDSTIVTATLGTSWRLFTGFALYGGDYVSTPFVRINRSNTNTFANGATYDIALLKVQKGNVLTDMTGGGNTGTLTNGPTYNSSNGGSLVFDGVDDRIECGTFSLQYLTISTWVYKTSSATNQGICRKETGWAVSQYNGTLQVAPGTSWTFYNTGYTIPLNTWVNIVYTYSGTGAAGSQTVYVNGSSIYSTSAGSGPITANSNAVRIGYDDNSWFWGGRIANTQIYNRALTAAEIKQNYNSIVSRFIGSTVDRPAPSASYLVSLGITANGYYYIDLPTLGSTLIYCILDPAVDGGGWMVLWGAASGATNYTYSFSASRDDISSSPINGFYSLSYAKRSAINALCTQNKTLVYAGSNSNWLRFDGYIWNSNSHTSGDFRFEFNSSLVTSNGTVDSSVEVGLTNYNVTTGGDFGIAINTDGLDHHSGSYYNLNNGCNSMYLYQYAAGYKVNTGLSGWYNSTAGCTSDNENDLPLLVAMK